MRSKLVVGNWKMNGATAANAGLLRQVAAIGRQDANPEVAVCVPAPYLAQARDELSGSGVSWGGQTLSQFAAGAYTGEVSARMLQDLGCRYVLVGHSERRTLFGEGDELVAQKVERALQEGLTPILCVGETLAQREAAQTGVVVTGQLGEVMERIGPTQLARCVIAYEPVWAIGTGRSATAEQAQEVHAALRAFAASRDAAVAQGLRILYGGSVKAAVAGELFRKNDIDGALVGGACLDGLEFAAICAAAR